MIEQEIERKIQDFRELGITDYIPRQDRVHIVDNMVSTIIGARRAGKSFRALQVADEFIRDGTIPSIDNICLLDFDNPILSNMATPEFQLIQNTFLKLNPKFELKTPILFVLDEIHKIPGWEEYIIDLSRNPNWKVIVTGSSSKLLKSDISTELRGKAISSILYPLSFTEFLRFKNFNYQPGSTKGQAELRRHFDEYLKWGGYPAVALAEEYSKEALLREYFDTMVLKDIIQRYNISKPRECIHLYNYLLSNISSAHTLQSAFRYLKQSRYSISRDTLREYLQWAEDSWLLFVVPVYSTSLKEQERNYKKIYSIDWALATKNSLSWDGAYSRLFENLVFIHLIRRWHRVHFYITKRKRQEIDFIPVDKEGRPVMLIQVCMDISKPDTLRRELEPLIASAKYFNTKENLIVTYNQEKEFNEKGVVIKAIPAWKWLKG